MIPELEDIYERKKHSMQNVDLAHNFNFLENFEKLKIMKSMSSNIKASDSVCGEYSFCCKNELRVDTVTYIGSYKNFHYKLIICNTEYLQNGVLQNLKFTYTLSLYNSLKLENTVIVSKELNKTIL